MAPLTFFSANGVTKISCEVFDSVNIRWKETTVILSAVVLPGVGFNVLLGLSWIFNAGVSLDVEHPWLLHKASEYTSKFMGIPKFPEEVYSFIIYDAEHCHGPAQARAKLVVSPFNQRCHRGLSQPELPQGLDATVLIYHQSSFIGYLQPGEVVGHSTLTIKI